MCICIYFNLHKQYIIAHSGHFFTLRLMCFVRLIVNISIFNLFLLTTAQLSMVCILCIFHLQLTITENDINSSMHLLVHIPMWTSESLPLRCVSRSRVTACKLWHIHFDWVVLEYFPEERHLCVVPSQGMKIPKCLPFTSAEAAVVSSCFQSSVYKMSCFNFISQLTIEFKTLICLLAFVVFSSVSCYFQFLDHFFLGVGILFWMTCKSSFVFQIVITCQL